MADGILTVTNGGQLTTGGGSIGSISGFTGKAEVKGSGSSWISNDVLYIGHAGNGILKITDGGSVTNNSSDTHLGFNAGSEGYLEVSGAGSHFTAPTSSLAIGTFGTGSMFISDGGVVTNAGPGYIASEAGSAGSVMVDGNGSAWHSGDGLFVGRSGDGVLTVRNGGSVATDKLILAHTAGSQAVLNIGSAAGLAPGDPGIIKSPIVILGDGDATLNFNHTAGDYSFNSLIEGNGRVDVNSGTTIFTAQNTYSGTTSVSAGRLLAGAENTFSANSAYTVYADGELALKGYSQTTGELTNSGIVNLGGGKAGTTLTVNGNYNGDNGLLIFNSVLGDDSSVTDRLVVAGDTSGTSYVKVNNLGGRGGATLNGIELINVKGSSQGQFIQQGRIVAGAYDYQVIKAGNNWYLSSEMNSPAIPEPTPVPEPTPAPEPVPTEPTPTPEPVPTPGPAAPTPAPEPAAPAPAPAPAPDRVPEPIPAKKKHVLRPEGGAYAANSAAASALFDTRLSERQGTLYTDIFTGEKKYTSLWMHIAGGHARSHDESGQLHTTNNRYVTMLGGDLASGKSPSGIWRVGVLAGHGNSRSNSVSNVTNYRATGEVDGYTAGIYGAWHAEGTDEKGLWLDGVLQHSWFNNAVSGENVATEYYRTRGLSASLESGYVIPLMQSARSRFFIQPQAQIAWSGISAVDHTEKNGTRISGEGSNNVRSRLGLKIFMKGHAAQDEANGRSFKPYLEANWIHNTQDYGVTMDSISVTQAGSRNIAEMKAGVAGNLSKKLSVSGNVGQQTGNNGWSDTVAAIGVKYTF
ncbi:autotransporter outer membrane beta-barrel domain-containing protein [Enterobacteriaceae bacterium H20N1]|uniref:Autotransporter outer membrane beta-barrel domain-containing protein n=1 Tax=Dryocola boscaweniae TaxID=2925397 RepID=A0A9X3ANA5_9ENTR|nr:autotransporter outer membrane beta-barrel domain-containing protein [Dryocola boscaweniae]MCT4701676.1 autotransporter outer membrane beta-barrel domain-containing protein [Dryocola boscaweniae]MCT4716319.1 autotransporter outer membrane beta-barrel domain-containing protein [Dryocola boscaweniae]MCT4718845.1 autotransporter outer membrane beta-barrel domain-containing protein [Dryocola boscaweniae]